MNWESHQWYSHQSFLQSSLLYFLEFVQLFALMLASGVCTQTLRCPFLLLPWRLSYSYRDTQFNQAMDSRHYWLENRGDVSAVLGIYHFRVVGLNACPEYVSSAQLIPCRSILAFRAAIFSPTSHIPKNSLYQRARISESTTSPQSHDYRPREGQNLPSCHKGLASYIVHPCPSSQYCSFDTRHSPL